MKQVNKAGEVGGVYIGDSYVGIIEEKDGLCIFTYDAKYLESPGAQSVSLTLPLRSEPYIEKTMIPFFDGLIPEGWLLNIVTENWKIDPRDRMALLLTVCQDCIGNIKIIPQRTRDV